MSLKASATGKNFGLWYVKLAHSHSNLCLFHTVFASFCVPFCISLFPNTSFCTLCCTFLIPHHFTLHVVLYVPYFTLPLSSRCSILPFLSSPYSVHCARHSLFHNASFCIVPYCPFPYSLHLSVLPFFPRHLILYTLLCSSYSSSPDSLHCDLHSLFHIASFCTLCCTFPIKYCLIHYAVLYNPYFSLSHFISVLYIPYSIRGLVIQRKAKMPGTMLEKVYLFFSLTCWWVWHHCDS